MMMFKSLYIAVLIKRAVAGRSNYVSVSIGWPFGPCLGFERLAAQVHVSNSRDTPRAAYPSKPRHGPIGPCLGFDRLAIWPMSRFR